MKPSRKQVAYAMLLLGKSGYPTDMMAPKHRELGDCPDFGTVEQWVKQLPRWEVSQLIDRLQGEWTMYDG